MAKMKDPKDLTRHMLTSRDRETMMAVLIRNHDVFLLFKDQLKPEDFDDLDIGYSLLWRTVLKFYSKFEALPGRALLLSDLNSRLEKDPDALNDTERSDLEAFVDIAFEDEDLTVWDEPLATSQKFRDWAVSYLKQFLEERLVLRIHEKILNENTVVSDLPGMLLTAQSESESIAAIQSGGAQPTFTADWDKAGGIKMFSTGYSFLDGFLNGGHAAGELYGFMGPFGSCKTTLAVGLTVNMARWAAELASQPDYDGVPGYAIYVSYEARLDSELRFRSLSNAARIARSSLETMGPEGIKSLSTWKTLKPYEKSFYKEDLLQNKKVPGERARAQDAIIMLNKHSLFLDMTGSDLERRGAGGGYVEEIARTISWEMRKRKGKPICVVIDYVGAMARRHIAAANKEDAALRHLIAGAPLRLKHLIADQFGVPVWNLHQLNGNANDKPPGARIYHTDAAEARSFGENHDFMFIVGTPTFDGLCQLACTKHRRTGAGKNEVIRIVGELNCVETTNGMYHVQDGKIVETKVANSVINKAKTVNGTLSSKASQILDKSQGSAASVEYNSDDFPD